MEISELGPDLGLVSTRIVSVRYPLTSSTPPKLVEPSRSSEPRISQVEAGVSAAEVSQSALLSLPSTQPQAPNTASTSAAISNMIAPMTPLRTL